MSPRALRRVALRLATLHPADREALLAGLGATAALALRPLIERCRAAGLDDPALAERALAEGLPRTAANDARPSPERLAELATLVAALPARWGAALLATRSAAEREAVLERAAAAERGALRRALEDGGMAIAPGLARALQAAVERRELAATGTRSEFLRLVAGA